MGSRPTKADSLLESNGFRFVQELLLRSILNPVVENITKTIFRVEKYIWDSTKELLKMRLLKN